MEGSNSDAFSSPDKAIFSESDDVQTSMCIKRPILKRSASVAFPYMCSPNIVVYVKPGDDEVFDNFLEIYKFIQDNYDKNLIQLYVEQELIDQVERQLKLENKYGIINDLQAFNPKDIEQKKKMKMIITLGGDGTILYAAKSFHEDYIPPIISFSMGSLGYLCYFEFQEYKEIITKVFLKEFTGDASIDPNLDLRMRLKVEVEDNPLRQVYKGNQIKTFQELHIQDYHCVNEVVIDKGPNPLCIQIEVYIDDKLFTTCVGDGLIVSTPTGSTAYNLAAGGPIIQANVPAIALTPLAPHSLSFRPLILPESAKITLKNPFNSRSTVWVALDGATRFELQQGEELLIQASKNAVAFVTSPSENLTDLWAQRLTKILNWNVRPTLKPIKKNGNSPMIPKSPEKKKD